MKFPNALQNARLFAAVFALTPALRADGQAAAVQPPSTQPLAENPAPNKGQVNNAAGKGQVKNTGDGDSPDKGQVNSGRVVGGLSADGGATADKGQVKNKGQVINGEAGGGRRDARQAAVRLDAQQVADDEVVLLEAQVVTAAPFRRDRAELAAATNVLAGEQLRRAAATSLGETLDGEPGLAASGFAPGASRPVIRGLGGARVLVLEDGLGTLDASVVSPDHAVALEPLLGGRVEVVRGPAALLHGSGAVGGVVNVIDGLIPESAGSAACSGRFGGQVNSDDNGRVGGGRLEGAAGGAVAWRLDGLRREAGNRRTPAGVVENSAVETEVLRGGLSWVGARGRAGVSATGFGSDYGAVAEEDVTIRLKRRQLAAEGALERLGGFFSGLRTKAGFTDYRHTEFEGDETGTVFKSRGGEARAELLHGRTGGFEGAWGARAGADRFSAEGEEAFLPASRTVSGEVFAFEEWARGGTRAQLAARAQFQRVRPEGGAARRDWTGAFSAGVVRDIGGGCAVTLSVTRSGRAPSAQELFADGPHAGTGAFEIGDSALACERVWSGDLGITRKTGRVTGALRVFATRFDGFISERATGEVRDGLPVYRFAQSDAVFWGAEAEAVFKLLDAPDNAVELRVTADAVRAETRGGARGRLPRMTPSRAGAELTWRGRWLTATAGLRAADRARRPAAEETATAGWCLVNAEVAVPVRAGGFSGEFFLRGTNLTNQLARNHVSLLKDKMAAGRRGVTAGARVAF